MNFRSLDFCYEMNLKFVVNITNRTAMQAYPSLYIIIFSLLEITFISGSLGGGSIQPEVNSVDYFHHVSWKTNQKNYFYGFFRFSFVIFLISLFLLWRNWKNTGKVRAMRWAVFPFTWNGPFSALSLLCLLWAVSFWWKSLPTILSLTK